MYEGASQWFVTSSCSHLLRGSWFLTPGFTWLGPTCGNHWLHTDSRIEPCMCSSWKYPCLSLMAYYWHNTQSWMMTTKNASPYMFYSEQWFCKRNPFRIMSGAVLGNVTDAKPWSQRRCRFRLIVCFAKLFAAKADKKLHNNKFPWSVLQDIIVICSSKELRYPWDWEYNLKFSQSYYHFG